MQELYHSYLSLQIVRISLLYVKHYDLCVRTGVYNYCPSVCYQFSHSGYFFYVVIPGLRLFQSFLSTNP